MNSFISSLYVLLDVIKAFGPVLASGFLGWVAYNQFKLAKSQSKISQEQLALAKQQADIAQRKVELDIRDKKHEVLKRWNQECNNLIYAVYNKELLEIYYKNFTKIYASSIVLLSLTDEMLIVFDDNNNINMYAENVREGCGELLALIEKKDNSADNVADKIHKMNRNRILLLENVYKVLGFN